jgi:hypothetical protein
MFNSHESEKLSAAHDAVRRMASFFCFRRKVLFKESTQTFYEFDRSFVVLMSKLEEHAEQISFKTEELQVLGNKHDRLMQNHLEVNSRLGLVSSLLSASVVTLN